MFPQLLWYSLHCLEVGLSCILSIDQDIVQIHYNKDIKRFNKNLIDVALKIGGCIEKPKGHDLVFEINISGTKDYLLFNTFSNPHLVISIGKI